jgi:TonB-linked SusC/RagA family outer membrane protein
MQNVQKSIRRSVKRIFAIALLLLVSTLTFAQSKVSGTVKDAQGEPLVGVSVVEVGTTNGTVTDIDGNYTLNVKPGAKLKVSYVGFTPQTITAGSTSAIKLLEDNKTLNEVVVVGYGTMRRKDVTSSITTIKSEDLNVGVFSDAASMLQGKVAGLVVTTTGDPNGSPSITLRGASSLRTGEAMQPYYVIDGIPGVDISMVAPDDIESIDVLRDATATAIYGSKAANGVIIITTKSGKNGKERTNVTYSGYVAFDNILKTLDMASADDIRNYVKANNIDYAYDGKSSTDWQDEVLRTAVSHNHNLSINGSSNKTTYLASVNYANREGVIKGSNMYRLNVRSLVSTKVLKDRLDLSAGVNALYAKHKGVATGVDGESVLDAMNYFNPTLPVTNSDGTWSAGSGSANYNPLSLINEDTSETIYKRMQFIGKASLKIIDGLVWNMNYSYNNLQSTYSAYDSHQSQLPGISDYNGRATRNTYFGDAQTFETYANYDKTFDKVHKVALMAGYSWEEKNNDDGFGLTVHNFFDDNLKWNNLTYAGTINGMTAVQSGTKETIRNISFYGRVSYSYNSKYMLQVTVRRDGSSVFGDGHKWGTFPSVSAAWNITEEPFMKTQNVFSNLKLRVGYGVSGNALGFGAYSAVKTYGSTGSYFTLNGNSYVTLGATKLANPDLKWESTGMLNIGIDYAIFGGRINGSIEFYNKKTNDLIWAYPVSSFIYPFNEIQANVGKITNTGIEFSLNATAIKTKNFTWNTTLNLSHNKNTVNKLSNDIYKTSTFAQGDPRVAGVSANGYTQRVMEGEPLGTFYTYEFAGYDASGKSTYYVHDEATGKRTGEVTNAPAYKDRTITGNAQPKLNLGWNNTFNYKNWNADMFFTGVFGNKIYNGTRAHYTAPDFFSGGKNVLKEFVTDRPATDNLSNIPSDRFIENGSYFRMQSLTVGYTFKQFDNWIQSAQLYVTCNNVFTITSYKGLDPEVNLGGIDPGVDYRWNNYPHTRTFMIGLKVNF